ncbi:oligosaccharide flippase family protein [Jiulongibacter sp. NS-SX5]|uniref:oligosaccharide flippase family protein n=1 Tax=Jiulongibacter sp. NS-SX5 TaxID=3463854 RepID=UPI004057F76F
MEVVSTKEKSKTSNSNYKSIAKSSGIIALVQVFQLGLGMLRNKIIAYYLGTIGFGIWGMYQTLTEMVSSFSSLGVNQSGVREIAKKSKYSEETAKSIFIVRTLVGCFSVISLILIIIWSNEISSSLFNTREYKNGIVIVGIAIFFQGFFINNKAILNGIRDIRGLAFSQIITAVIASVLVIGLIYYLDEDGIPISFLVISIIGVVISYVFLRKNGLRRIIPSMVDFKAESKELIRLGIGFSGSAAIAAVATYLTRTYLVSNYDLSVVGVYQASWTISNLYVGVLLSAMGVDFMPRLSKLIGEKLKMINLVNEQIELGVLIASVGVVFIISFSDIILELLYSSSFREGQVIIKWQILGVFLRVLGYPFSHLLMVNKKSLMYTIAQAIFWFGDYLLLIFFDKIFGYESLGMNYFSAYVIYLTLTWILCNRLFHFKASKLVVTIVTISVGFISCALCTSYLVSSPLNYILNSLLVVIMLLWITRTLNKNMGIRIKSILFNRLRK